MLFCSDFNRPMAQHQENCDVCRVCATLFLELGTINWLGLPGGVPFGTWHHSERPSSKLTRSFQLKDELMSFVLQNFPHRRNCQFRRECNGVLQWRCVSFVLEHNKYVLSLKRKKRFHTGRKKHIFLEDDISLAHKKQRAKLFPCITESGSSTAVGNRGRLDLMDRGGELGIES